MARQPLAFFCPAAATLLIAATTLHIGSSTSISSSINNSSSSRGRIYSSSSISLGMSEYYVALGGGVAGQMNCIEARQQCIMEPSCRNALTMLHKICGPELVACSTVTPDKCKLLLRHLRSFEQLSNCACAQPHIDFTCDMFKDVIFNHPCDSLDDKDESLARKERLPNCMDVERKCKGDLQCFSKYNDFINSCKSCSDECVTSWNEIRHTEYFGCVCEFGGYSDHRTARQTQYYPVRKTDLIRPNNDPESVYDQCMAIYNSTHENRCLVSPKGNRDLERGPQIENAQTTCHVALDECQRDNQCQPLLTELQIWCEHSTCEPDRCRYALQKFYDSVRIVRRMQVAFCVCRQNDPNKECLKAMRQLHPTCAERHSGRGPTKCHQIAQQCRTNKLCSSKLEDYEQKCAADVMTGKCSHNYRACQQAVMNILGTELHATCVCKGTDFLHQHDCYTWQKLLWSNPCVIESHLALQEEIRNDASILDNVFTSRPQLETTEVLSEESGPVINSISYEGTFSNGGYKNEGTGTRYFSNSTGLELRCMVRGSPQPSIYWVYAKEDGTAVQFNQFFPPIRRVQENGTTLIFTPFRAEEYDQDIHDNVYRCGAFNDHGSVISKDIHIKAVVHQKYHPRIISAPVISGNTGILYCLIPHGFDDIVTVNSWVADSGENYYLGDSYDSKYSMLPSGELHIKNVTKEDGDTSYRCRTKNKLTGETILSQAAGKLKITEPEGRSAPQLKMYAPEGEDFKRVIHSTGTVELPCVIQASPAPDFRWYKFEVSGKRNIEVNDRIIQVGGTLIIKEAKVEDDARYQCVANNIIASYNIANNIIDQHHASYTVDVFLTVTAPLSAVVEPKVQAVEFGRPATFTCNYKGNPINSITWFKDGIKLNHTDAVFQIQAVSHEDKGMYQCFIKNDQDSAQGTAELKIGGCFVPPQLTYKFEEAFLQPNNTVSLKCMAEGKPTPEIIWKLDGTRLSCSESIQVGQYISNNGEVVSHLNISRAITKDGGLYACIASSSVGSVEHTARVNVLGLPYIKPMDNVTVLSGENIVVHCPWAGYPVGSIVWEKDGVQLPLRLNSTYGTLTVENVERSVDQGRYTCVAKNSQGDTARGDLDVQVKDHDLCQLDIFDVTKCDGDLKNICPSMCQSDSIA